MDPRIWWYLTRASGVTSWVFATASVVTGLVLSSRRLERRRPNWQLDLHRHESTLALGALALHLAALVADSYVHVTVADLFVPLHLDWRPKAVALGILGLYGMVLVEVSSRLRRHLGKRTWRSLHLLSYAVFALTTAHFVSAGTDARNPVLRALVLLAVVLVGGLTIVRVTTAAGDGRGEPVRVAPRAAGGPGAPMAAPGAGRPRRG